ncbi:4768_t:CDS:2 [Paraglomus brasilianum]|uniref:Adenosine kinase n=1 Tax=Paraglomus brasilianum TaxID=144538 RepID=A0A9N8WEP7_9GLOM|nr:4768_t:CDS:2 [Paraglomus brasilianum]
MGEYKLFCMGNPLLDIQVNGDESLLNKYGLEANASILAEEKHKPLQHILLTLRFEELVQDYTPVYVAGGAAQNAARGAQYLLPPQSTVYVGCVGNDQFAVKLRQAAEKDGLRVEYMVVNDVPTGTCAAIITGQNRSLVANLSAAEKYHVSDIKTPEKWKWVENADYFYIGGFFLTVSVESILEVAKYAAEHNKPFTLNLSAAFLCQFFKDQLDSVLPYCDILFGNETEAEAYATNHNWDTKDIKQIALHISKLPKVNSKRERIVVITQGENATLVAYSNGTVNEYPVTLIDKKDIVDTNGAGDAFVGGFLSQYVQGKTIGESVAAAHWLARKSIQLVGPAYPEEKLTYPPL